MTEVFLFFFFVSPSSPIRMKTVATSLFLHKPRGACIPTHIGNGHVKRKRARFMVRVSLSSIPSFLSSFSFYSPALSREEKGRPAYIHLSTSPERKTTRTKASQRSKVHPPRKKEKENKTTERKHDRRGENVTKERKKDARAEEREREKERRTCLSPIPIMEDEVNAGASHELFR